MTAELVSVASLIIMHMFVARCCVVIMYVAVMVACETRVFPLQGPEMVGRQQIVDHGAAEGRQNVRGNMQTVNRRMGNRARPQEHDERLCWVRQLLNEQIIFILTNAVSLLFMPLKH